MKTMQVIIEATYAGRIPVEPIKGMPAESPNYGINKYIGYDHLFKNCLWNAGGYSQCRARKIPSGLKAGQRYKLACSFKSSILSNVKLIRRVNNQHQ